MTLVERERLLAQQERALELVSKGHSHERAGQEMGVSASEVGRLIAQAMSRVKNGKLAPATVEPVDYELTRREWDVWALVAKGLRTVAIADRLKIDTSTAKNHVYSLYKGIGVTSRIAAALLFENANKPGHIKGANK